VDHPQNQWRKSPEFLKITDRGRYKQILETWRGKISSDRLLIRYFDSILEDGMTLLNEVCAFLDVDFEAHTFPDVRKVVNKGIELEMPVLVYDFLRQSLEADIRYAAEMLGGAACHWVRRHYSS
jgi:hypothetical protein